MQPEPIKRTLDVRRDIKQCPTCGRRFSRDASFCPFDGVRLGATTFDPLGDPLVGTTIDGRYAVLEVLGEGGMGRVYKVRHATLERSFAMKVLRRDLARDEDLVGRFLLEAKATASVKHPNVVQITDFGRFPDGVPYFVMELLVGHTLGAIIKAGGPIPAGRAVRIVQKVAGALGAAHEAGIVHRDLKPDNVFLVGVGRDGERPESPERGRSLAMLGDQADVRVVDFGAAKIIGSSRVTREGIVFGTPHYMSPEQASGQPVDHRADIYALGVIMYEMFTGRVPFEADTYMGVLTQHMFVQPVPPSQVSAAAKELGALEDITLVCLAKKPEERFGSMHDLATAIDDVMRLREGGAPSGPRLPRRPGGVPPNFRHRMADELEPPTLEEMRGAVGGALPMRRGLWAWIVAIGVVALSFAAWSLLRDAPQATRPAASATTASGPAPSKAEMPLPAPPQPPPSAAEMAPMIPLEPTAAAAPPPRPAVHRPVAAPPSASRARGTIDELDDPFTPKR
jgi:eukaryotic-like serine/threonine-protein kinase